MARRTELKEDAAISLVGLIEEAIFVGEERELRPPALDVPTLVALARKPPKRAVAVTIASAVEIPSFVATRFATLCDVLHVSAESIVLRGVGRARITEALGKEPPFSCRVEATTDVQNSDELAAAASSVFDALRRGAAPPASAWRPRVREAVAALVRAVSTPDELRAAQATTLEDATKRAAVALEGTIEVERATTQLESILSQAKSPGLAPHARRRLWAQVVEVQKSLDIYDPGAGDNVDDLLRLQRRLQQAGLPPAASEIAKRELRMLRGMESSHHDFSTYFAHLDLMSRLAWHPETLPPIDLDRVQRSLDVEHAGLDKPKRRVLEHLAVRALGGAAQNMILCLAGPPGVGKTTLARVVAESLGRKFVRVALGGVHDEAEIRGHRKSFTAAGAGRILTGLAQARSATAVVLLDEIDKIGTDTQRSPAAALLEVLDPEQNKHFSDNYLAVPYDLSNVIFIATANDTSRIHPIVLDRLEVVELDGYTTEEKLDIARRHLLERMRVDHGLPKGLVIDDEVLVGIVESHTREAGVRQLQRALAAFYRDKALALARGEGNVSMKVEAGEVARVLGPPIHARERARAELPIGTAVGLSVSGDGGALVFVELVALPGQAKLRMTGRLGEIMREAVRTALAHLRANAERYGIDPAALEREMHLHVPEAATSKEGPSAGLATLAAFVSLARGEPLPADVAMTGEISLAGRILPVGGVPAKLLAADRAGVGRVLIPQANAEEVPAGLRARVIPVSHVEAALAVLFPALAEERPTLAVAGQA